MAEFDLEGELVLRGAEGRYTREVGERWNVGGERAFGGYGAALALVAACAATGLPRARSLYTMFLDPLRFGPVDLTVDVLRRGRVVGAVQVDATQNDRRVLTMTAWLTADQPPPRTPVADPDEPDRNWAGGQWPVLDFAERRGARYPDSPTAFAGQREIELWLRPTVAAPDQVVDVLILDGHLLDAPLCVLGNIDAAMASLDLSVTWLASDAPPPGGWRRLHASGEVGDGGVSAAGSLSWGDERPYAVASTQAVARR